MANHPNPEGDAHGLSPEPAGSKPSDGDRPCRVCEGRKMTKINLGGSLVNWTCDHCSGTGVEPSVAPRPGSSLFSPPAPSQQLEGRRAALTKAEERFVEAWDASMAAAFAWGMNQSNEQLRVRVLETTAALSSAAAPLVREILERAEGGLNT